MLYIDYETRSQIDLKRRGTLRYAMSPTTEMICMAYAFDDEEPEIWWNDEPVPERVLTYVLGDGPIWAFNADFERHITDFVTSNDHGLIVSLERWRCAMVLALAHGLPASLDKVAEALGLTVRKNAQGARLIREYCKKGHLTEFKEGDRELMQEYAIFDVKVLQAVVASLRELSADEWENYHMTCRINDKGLPVDLELIDAVLAYKEAVNDDINNKISDLTDGRMTKHTQRKSRDAWMFPKLTEEQIKLLEVYKNGKKSISLDQEHRDILLSVGDLDPDVYRLVSYLNDASSSAINKFDAAGATHVEGRVYNTFQFHGAQTGRFAGRGIQPHNMRRDVFKQDAAEALIQKIKNGDEIDEPANTMARLCRPMVHSEKGISFVDWSAIEGRASPWLANSELGERKLQLYRDEKDVYVETAADMFNILVEDITDDYRQSGKVCLARDTKILTDVGLVPIQDVTTDMLLWDGVEWVSHDGPICNGVKEVLTYDNITATPDHKVWTWDGRQVQIQEAQRKGWRLDVTGYSRYPIPSADSRTEGTRKPKRFWAHLIDRGPMAQTELQTQREVWDILNAGPRNRFTAGGRLVANCELSLQFGGGSGALQGMAKNYGMFLDDDEAANLVKLWRRANKWAVDLWPKFERAARKAVLNIGTPYAAERVTFQSDGNFLWCMLPSGRLLAYYNPRYEQTVTPWGEERMAATFQTSIKMKQVDIKKQKDDAPPYYRNSLRGSLLMQNATQAVAADLLIDALRRCQDEGLNIIGSVHDEIIDEGDIAEGEKLNEIMLTPPAWAEGLPLATGGVAHANRYGK